LQEEPLKDRRSGRNVRGKENATNKERKLKATATSEEGDSNWKPHQRMKQEMGAMSGKQGIYVFDFEGEMFGWITIIPVIVP
jgi:hypothetical protein